MRRFLLFTAIAGLSGFPAFAQEDPKSLCPYYGGHIDVEGKYGSRRNIGETSVFLPLACNDEKLLFSDLRFKGDNKSNREGNVGLGARFLRETGIIGSYVYFDRKLSGESDKYHSQVTMGAEWLAENWEVRGNAYMPLTSAKTVGATNPSVRPVLSGSSIFIEETAGNILKEESLYGADVEAGLKIPDARTWLHLGGFSFSGKDSASLDGVRARAAFQLTDNIALTAEGQYDDERGRQGWIGARLTIPFGGPAKKNEGLKARMTASPVRDVDIVTDVIEKRSGQTRTVEIKNAASGASQRILYVDNNNAAAGDGTAENPFSTLAAAEAAMADNDIVYIRSGNGTSTGMDQGLTIARNNVQVIGSGSAFVYDRRKLTTSASAIQSGTVLIAAGAKPVLTNVNASGDGIYITGTDALVAGLTVDGASRHGIYASSNANDIGDITVSDVSILNSGSNGFNYEGFFGAHAENILLRNVTSNANGGYGARVDTLLNTTIESVTIQNANFASNGSAGFTFAATLASVVDRLSLENINTSANVGGSMEISTFGTGSSLSSVTGRSINSTNDIGKGLIFWARSDSDIGDIELTGLRVMNNQNSPALHVFASDSRIDNVLVDGANLINSGSIGLFLDASGPGAAINNMLMNNVTIEGSASLGILSAASNGAAFNAAMRNSRIAAGNAIWLSDSGATAYSFDFGSGAGGYNNLESTMYLSIQGANISARNNWWGQSGGPRVGPDQIQNANPGNCPSECGTADIAGALSVAPQ